MVKVIYVDEDTVRFEDGTEMYSFHYTDCCEQHWLTFENLSLSDFEGLDFDLSGDSFFERVAGYGIRLVPISGHPVSVPGYGDNNGYYSSNLTLVLAKRGGWKREFDIIECQS